MTQFTIWSGARSTGRDCSRKSTFDSARELIAEIADAYDLEITELEVSEDHVHILLSFPPRLSIGSVVGMLKNLSAHALFNEYPSVKHKLWGGKLWEDGYFAQTVGDTMTGDIVKRYIQHHREKQAPAQLELELG